MGEWRRMRFVDHITIKHGYAFSGDQFSESSEFPTVVTPGNFSRGGGFKIARPKTFSGFIPNEYLLRPGSLVVSMTDLSKSGDTLGVSAIIPDDGVQYLHNQRIGSVDVTTPYELDISFLNYRMRASDYRAHVLGSASGTTVRHTSPMKICQFVALMPGLDEQRRIARLLEALDSKIKNNSVMLEKVRQILELVYKGARRDSIRIPVSSLARFVNGGAFTKGATGHGRMVVRIADLNSGPSPTTVFNELDVPDDQVVRAGDMLMSWSGSLGVYRWHLGEAVVNQHIFKVIPKRGYEDWLVFLALREKIDEYRQVAADKATTMGHIRRRDLDSPVLIPDANARQAIHGEMQKIWEISLNLQVENDSLSRMQDALLDGLMSGTLSVHAAGELVSGAV